MDLSDSKRRRPGDCMRYVSTRASGIAVSLSEAIERGLAEDGGLYVPERFPTISCADLKRAGSLPEIAVLLLEAFFEGDALASSLATISSEALNFPMPLVDLGRDTAVLELFHGPTAAFKDVGARFLAGCFGSIPCSDKRTVLVATSGDTGGAVASAFHRRPGVDVAILFPSGGVSPLQEKQLTCWGENVQSFKMRGTFDDCQRLVKTAFAARGTNEGISGRHLTSANSISMGRLLPQMVYYAWASVQYEAKTGVAPGFVIPTGNVGNAMAAVWVMALGLPIREIVLATNANRVVPEYLGTGVFTPQPSRKTLANAMDVGNPSNLERLIRLLGHEPALRQRIQALSVNDAEIRDAIVEGPRRYGQIWCPHTAVAVRAREQQDSPHWIIVSTAHPAKFGDIVEPLLGQTVPMPAQLRALLDKPSHCTEIGSDYAEFRAAMGVDTDRESR